MASLLLSSTPKPSAKKIYIFSLLSLVIMASLSSTSLSPESSSFVSSVTTSD